MDARQIETKLTITNNHLNFCFSGAESNVKILARELYYHYSGNFLFDEAFQVKEKIELIGNDTIKHESHRTVSYNISTALSNHSGLVTLFWCIGNLTGKFINPADTVGGPAVAAAATSAMERDDISFDYKFKNIEHLKAEGVVKSFWTSAELTEEANRLQTEEAKLITVSWKNWGLSFFRASSEEASKQTAKTCPRIKLGFL